MCEWCQNPNADDVSDPGKLCRMHAAEYEGLTVDQMDLRDSIEYAEEYDATH